LTTEWHKTEKPGNDSITKTKNEIPKLEKPSKSLLSLYDSRNKTHTFPSGLKLVQRSNSGNSSIGILIKTGTNGEITRLINGQLICLNALLKENHKLSGISMDYGRDYCFFSIDVPSTNLDTESVLNSAKTLINALFEMKDIEEAGDRYMHCIQQTIMNSFKDYNADHRGKELRTATYLACFGRSPMALPMIAKPEQIFDSVSGVNSKLEKAVVEDKQLIRVKEKVSAYSRGLSLKDKFLYDISRGSWKSDKLDDFGKYQIEFDQRVYKIQHMILRNIFTEITGVKKFKKMYYDPENVTVLMDNCEPDSSNNHRIKMKQLADAVSGHFDLKFDELKVIGVMNPEFKPDIIGKTDYIGGHFYQNAYNPTKIKNASDILTEAGLVYEKTVSFDASENVKTVNLDQINTEFNQSSQTHVSITYPVTNPTLKDSIVLQVLRTILGGANLYTDRKSMINLKSKLVENVNSSGFIESCYANYQMHQTCGTFSIEYVSEPHYLYKTTELVMDQILAVKKLKITQEELNRARNLLKFKKLHPKFEKDYVENQNFVSARSEENIGRWKDFYINGSFIEEYEWLRIVDKLELNDLFLVIVEFFYHEKPSVAAVGEVASMPEYEDILRVLNGGYDKAELDVPEELRFENQNMKERLKLRKKMRRGGL
jgi:hypothetical protein